MSNPEYVTWREARENFADLINRVWYQNARIVITRHGKVVAELKRPERPAREAPQSLESAAQRQAIAL